MRIPGLVIFAALTSLGGCSCEAANTNGLDGALPGFLDAAGSGDGAIGGAADAAGSGDGAIGSGADGTIGRADGSTTATDGGDPLQQPLPEFCRGMGTVVGVGGNGACAGDLAAQTFQMAVCACETIDVQSNLEIDAFDSRVGPYGGANVVADGHLGLNRGLDMDGKLTVRGNTYAAGGGFSVGSQSEVTGTLYSGGDAVQDRSSTSIGRNAFVDGDVTGRYDITGDLHVPAGAMIDNATQIGGATIREMIPSTPPCPCDDADILDVGAITRFGRTHNDNGRVLTSTAYENGGPGTLRLPCGRYYLTRVQQPGSLNIIAEGRTVLFIDGDLAIGGGFDLSLADDAEVDLFVNGSLSIGASARLGDQAHPSKVRTYVGGTSTIALSASTVFGGNLYAPRARVTFAASSTLYGALFARHASFGGSASVHFDRAVRAAGDTCDDPMMSGGDAGPAVGDGGGATGSDAGGAGGADASSGDSGAGAMCTGCFTADQTPNICGPCDSDLDCCAPLVCLGGACMLNF